MSVPMSRIAERMFNTPLMLDLAKAQVIADSFAPRVLGQGVTVNTMVQVADGAAQMGVIGDKLANAVDGWGQKNARPLDVFDGVAVIEIEGSLVHKGKWIGQSSGLTSYEALLNRINMAFDPAVKGVVFEVDSFGGEVAGAFDCAEALYELSLEKPTMAILTDHACSAGYLLASACGSITMPQTGLVGSIGVVMMHADYSGLLKREGVAVTLLHDGAHKVDGNPYEALPAAVRDRLQDQLAQSRTLFAETVGRYRGSRFTASQALATEAQVFHGDEALGLGLVDAVARPGKAFAAFVEEVN